MTIAGGRHITFEHSNRSKRGITLNLKNEKARQILYQLIDKADVFYTNYREKVLKELGADYETLSQRNPSLVYGKADMFGIKGPWAERRGYDFMGQARSGFMWAVGDRDWPEPVLGYGSLCDESTATMFAFALVTALLAKERKGIGQRVDTSMYGTMIHIQTAGLYVTSLRGRPWARHSRTRVREPMSNFYKCADGKWMLLVEMRGDQFWPQFARVMGLEHLADDPKFATAKGRRENFKEVIQTLDEAFATKTLPEWLDIYEKEGLAKAGFSYCPIYDYFDVLKDPQALANDYIVDFDHPTAGKIKVVGYPMQFSDTPAEVKCAAPEHGQHTEEVLSELCGLSWEEMAKLRDEGVI
jgi:crotonobetainyl-CoA:carnitine CoA-transferase CaiB-like acyl-CoA transferase